MRKIAAALVTVSLLVLGLGQLYLAGTMPVFRDEGKYQATYEAINTALREQTITSDEASERFYQNQHDNMSNKYWLESSGWFYVIVAVYGIIGLAAVTYMQKAKKRLRSGWLYGLVFINTCGVVVLGATSVLIDFERGLFPHWADSLGIPLFGSAFFLLSALPVMIGAAVVLQRRYKQEKPDFSFGKFRRLSTGYKVYFIVTTGLLLYVFGRALPYPVYDLAPLVAGGLLYNFLLFAGLQEVGVKHHKNT